LNLWRQHYPPYYLIPDIHKNALENIEQVEDEDNMVHVVGHGTQSTGSDNNEGSLENGELECAKNKGDTEGNLVAYSVSIWGG
jgi:hypothetical protein